jgi:hypothetical protein
VASLREIPIANFYGGLNTRDLASELRDDEIPDALNVTLDERGAPTKRLGYERRYSTAIAASRVSNLFHWATRGHIVSQIGTTMHLNNGAAFHTWTTSDRCGMCEFNDTLVMIHPVDGVRSYDGTTVSAAPANSPKGDTCATWQGKVWLAGNPDNPSRVTYSAIAALTFTTTSWVDLKEKDSSKVTCLAGAAGLDVSGRPGLLAFKADSAYRIYDSSTGAYNTIDASVGCGSNIGAISAYGRTYTISTRGIYFTNGIDPMVEASAKIENYFNPTIINQTRADLYAAGRYQDRLWFSVPAAGETENSIAIELHPLSAGSGQGAGWIMVHTNAASCYASLGRAATDLVMGSPSANGLIFNSHKTGSDDGAQIASVFQTRWLEPNYGNKVRIRRLRFVGSGSFAAALYKDYEAGQSLPSVNVAITFGGPTYDDPGSVYDSGDLYGPLGFQGIQDFWSIGVVRSFSVRITETSSLTQDAQAVAGISGGIRGAWTLAHISLMAIDLGFR